MFKPKRKNIVQQRVMVLFGVYFEHIFSGSAWVPKFLQLDK